ncbi:MAG: hypothetical protein U0X20_03230 [Caldilineaceae bacterium]
MAFTLDGGANWQASWMDYVDNRAVALAADPRAGDRRAAGRQRGGGGVLRSFDRVGAHGGRPTMGCTTTRCWRWPGAAGS